MLNVAGVDGYIKWARSENGLPVHAATIDKAEDTTAAEDNKEKVEEKKPSTFAIKTECTKGTITLSRKKAEEGKTVTFK